jgi:hypothetical protein
MAEHVVSLRDILATLDAGAAPCHRDKTSGSNDTSSIFETPLVPYFGAT